MFYFRPRNVWVGDVIPFFDDGRFWLYYLHDQRDKADEPAATSWHLLCTENLVDISDLGEVLPRGGDTDADRNAYTGSVVAVDDQYHAFYTGHNPSITNREGQALQAVMHAVSDDRVTWKKVAGDTFYAPEGQYDPVCWRDPFVFHDPRSDEYSMLLAARDPSGSSRRGGCVGWCTSTDLQAWTPREPFWAPGLFVTHECPDLFQMGNWWYLVYSEFSERFATRYRMSRSLDGPWIAPVEDALDGRAFYAAKTASDGTCRYAFGWLASKAGERDDGAWEWGGQLAIHEVVQNPDGTLGVRLPQPIRAAFTVVQHFERVGHVGDWHTSGGAIRGSSVDGLATLSFDDLPLRCLISGTVRFDSAPHACGLTLRTGPASDDGYVIRIEPERRRLVFDRWPRNGPGPLEWQIAGDVAHAVELERTIEVADGVPQDFEILIDDSACTVYLDGRIAMSARMYDRRQGGWGLFVQQGSAEFHDLKVRTSDFDNTTATGGKP